MGFHAKCEDCGNDMHKIGIPYLSGKALCLVA